MAVQWSICGIQGMGIYRVSEPQHVQSQKSSLLKMVLAPASQEILWDPVLKPEQSWLSRFPIPYLVRLPACGNCTASVIGTLWPLPLQEGDFTSPFSVLLSRAVTLAYIQCSTMALDLHVQLCACHFRSVWRRRESQAPPFSCLEILTGTLMVCTASCFPHFIP
jgi:hypothetical protein